MGVLGSFWTHHKHGYWLGYLAIFILDPHDSQWLYGPYGVLIWVPIFDYVYKKAAIFKKGGPQSRDIP